MRLPRVSDYMDTVVHTVTPDMEIRSAVRFLLDRHVTGAPVVDDQLRVVGVLSEKDCLRLLAEGSDGDMAAGTVADFMSTEVISVLPRMNIYFVAGMFLRDVVRRFPVVEDGKLVGAITRFDILRAIQTNLKDP